MVNENRQPQRITTYLGSMLFENNVLQFVGMAEGGYRAAPGGWTIDYFSKDHLGNVRIMLAENEEVRKKHIIIRSDSNKKEYRTATQSSYSKIKIKRFRGKDAMMI